MTGSAVPSTALADPRRASRAAARAPARRSGSGCGGRRRARGAAAPRCGRCPRPARTGRRTRTPESPRRAAGGSPGSCRAGPRSLRTPPRGRQRSRPTVYGWRGSLKHLRRPGPPRPAGRRTARRRGRTSSRSTSRLWLMNRTLVPNSLRAARRSRSSTSASTVASRPVVGSSRISSVGSFASAIAITTRCCMPPESWCG